MLTDSGSGPGCGRAGPLQLGLTPEFVLVGEPTESKLGLGT